jgi:citrate synthase
MKGPKVLLEYEDNWVTEMGAWFPGERVVYRGKDLLWELQDQRWMGLLLYGITGRIFSDKQVKLFEGLWVLSSSFPELRLWNNRVAALAGTARSTASLGLGAAISVSEATIYGRRPDIKAIDFLIRTMDRLSDGVELGDLVRAELTQYRGIPGYGRPIVGVDERIEPIMILARELGFTDGQFVKLAFEIQDILLKGRFRLHMNVAMLAAALAADQGLNRREFYHYTILCFTAGMFPCFIEAATSPEGALFPLRCTRVLYEGKPRRPWHSASPE